MSIPSGSVRCSAVRDPALSPGDVSPAPRGLFSAPAYMLCGTAAEVAWAPLIWPAAPATIRKLTATGIGHATRLNRCIGYFLSC